MPNPTSQKHGVPIQKSIIFFIRILPVFFARVSPASQRAKPACIKNTSIAAISTQITSVAEYIKFPPFSLRYKKMHLRDGTALWMHVFVL